MTDFLLELRSEEIPARMQDKAREDLARLFAAELGKAGIAAATETVTYATPRRLALIARGLPQATEAMREELKGPPADGAEAAVEGFLRKAGVTRDMLETREVKGRATLFAVVEKPGRATADVLAAAIPAIIRAFPWPKSMRWGAASLSTESMRWVRPLQGIVALFGDEVVPVSIADVESGAATLGHRFHHPGGITIGSAADYVEKLRACHVIVDQDERRALIRDRATALAEAAGLVLVEDEGLVAENAGLTEWPVPLLGRFDEAFLDVPPEVIQLTARVNQKYFVCREREGRLANAFVCTANIAATDGGARIVEGNRKVLAARLSDARFFYETDLKVPLEEQAKKLEKIVFHEKLGTVADKVDRVAKLARWLVEEGIVPSTPFVPSEVEGHAADDAPEPRASTALGTSGEGADRATLAALAERAARLAKADLVTGMVGEFPELQGLMGGYYAAAQGEHPAVAAAIRDHYKPVGQGDDVPTDPVTVAVSLADKLDSLFQFFLINEKSTGSKDPFALRRGALGVASLVIQNDLRVRLRYALDFCGDIEDAIFDSQPEAAWIAKCGKTRDDLLAAGFTGNSEEIGGMLRGWPVGIARDGVVAFIIDRLKVQQREAGVRHDLIDAVFALGGEDDLVRLLARVKALQAFVGTADGTNLLAGYKRAANILKKEGHPAPAGDDTPATPVTPAKAGVSGDGAGQEPRETPASAGVTNLAVKNWQNTLSYTPEIAETALIAALDAAEPAAASAVAREDFEGAMAALATLRAPIDAFFDGVIVNDPDPAKRSQRLALLDRVRAAVHQVADFSRIEG